MTHETGVGTVNVVVTEFRTSDLPDEDTVIESALMWQARGVEHTDVLLAVASLERATKLINSRIEALLKPFNLTFSRFAVLSRLYWTRSGSMTLGEIATMLVVHPTSVTSAIDRLERDGLVERVPHPTDRRAMLAKVTAAGKSLVKQATPKLTEAKFGFADVDDRTLGDISIVLRRVRAAAGDLVADERKYRDVIQGRPIAP